MYFLSYFWQPIIFVKMPGPNNIAKTWLIYNHKEKEIRNII